MSIFKKLLIIQEITSYFYGIKMPLNINGHLVLFKYLDNSHSIIINNISDDFRFIDKYIGEEMTKVIEDENFQLFNEYFKLCNRISLFGYEGGSIERLVKLRKILGGNN